MTQLYMLTRDDAHYRRYIVKRPSWSAWRRSHLWCFPTREEAEKERDDLIGRHAKPHGQTYEIETHESGVTLLDMAQRGYEV